MCILSLIAWLCHILKNVQWVILIFVFHVPIGISEHKAIKLRFSHYVKSVPPCHNGHAFRFPEGFLCIANHKVLMLSRKDSSWILLISNKKPSSHQCFQVIGRICGSYIAQITCISKSGILLSVTYLVRIVIKKHKFELEYQYGYSNVVMQYMLKVWSDVTYLTLKNNQTDVTKCSVKGLCPLHEQKGEEQEWNLWF